MKKYLLSLTIAVLALLNAVATKAGPDACKCISVTDPTSVTTCAGTTASFSVTASGGSGYTYQWQVNPAGSPNWNNISGATNASYSFSCSTTDDGSKYRCTVTGTCICGTDAATSANNVTLSVQTAPSFTSSPSNATKNANANCWAQVNYASSLTVTGTPTPIYSYTVTGATTGNGTNSSGSGAVNFNGGVTTVQIASSNVCGTAYAPSFTVTVNDITPPSISSTPANVTANANSSGCTWTGSLGGTITATDNCSGSVAVSNDAPSAFSVGTTTVTWTATDGSGNSSTSTQTVIISNPVTATTSVSGNVVTVNATGGTSTYSYSGTGTQSGNQFTVSAPGTYSYTATDGNGCSYTASATVTCSTPTVSCTGMNISQGNDAGNCSAVVNYTASPLVTGMPTPTVSYSTPSGSAINVGTTTVTVTATNICGSASDNFTVTVTDNQVPVITTNGDQSVNNDAGVCGATVAISATAADNCGVGSPTNDWVGGPFPVGTTTVHWTVTDVNGNVGTATQNITVTDNQAPVITTNGDQSVNNDAGVCGATVTISATATDNCGVGSPTNDWIGGPFPVGTTTVHWTVTDVNGNVGTATQNITVTDNQAPVITTNGDQSVNNDAGVCGATVAISATAVDNCGVGSPTNDWVGGPFPVGTTTVHWTVTDVNGNVGTATQNITVTDNEAPVITTNGDQSVNNDAGVCGATVAISATATDNCGVGSPTNDWAGGTFPVGTTTVHWAVTDVNGNVGTATQNITVTDNEAPHALCMNKTVNLSDVSSGGTASISLADIDNSSWDNCGIASKSLSKTSFDCSNVGSNTVTLTITDIHNLSATCTANVTVVDNSAPHAYCRNKTVYLSDVISGGTASITTSDINNSSWDNCSLGTLSLSKTSFNCSNVGSNTVTLTVPDVNGNSSSCTATVTVVDNSAPHAICQNYTITLTGLSSCTKSITASNINNGSWDNCTISSTSVSPSTFGCSNVGNNTVTLTVNDVNGNSSTCTATVTVQQVAGTYSQGAWGGNGSHCYPTSCTTWSSGNATTIMTSLLNTSMTIGNGSYYITIPAGGTGASSVYSAMPGSGTPGALSSTSHTLSGFTSGGKISNVLISQTIALSMSVRMSNVGCFPIQGGSFYTKNNTASVCGTFTGGSCTSYSLPSNVVSYLATHYTSDVNGLLTLANDALGHVYTPSGSNPTYSDINNAINTVITAFDSYRLFGGNYGTVTCPAGREIEPGTYTEQPEQEYKVYPNPTTGMLNVVIPVSDNEAQVMILDITGRTIATQTVAPNSNAPLEFNLSNVANGIYLVKVNVDGNIHVEKFIKN